jgi:hypothetical protein
MGLPPGGRVQSLDAVAVSRATQVHFVHDLPCQGSSAKLVAVEVAKVRRVKM